MPSLAVAALTAVFAWACAAFVRQPMLATFADDSVTYLVMAQAFSPWQPASAPVAEAFLREGFYPPLFPLVLALAGAAHDISRAHVVTALMLAACLPVLYLFSATLMNRWAAVASVAVTAILPAMWINAKGILSEPLYCLALLMFLWAAQRRLIGWLVVSAAALVLTRTAGLALVAAYAVWALTQRDRVKLLVPAAVALVAYGAWVAMRPAGDINVAYLSESPWRLDIGRQAASIAEAWIGSLIIYWVDDRPLRTALAAAAGLLALTGLFLRLKERKPDGWIMLAYLATFLAWPFHDQMGRFIFPALPVLVVYAFHAGGILLRRPATGYAVAAVLYVSLAAPAAAFLYQRAVAPAPYPQMVDWYRYPDWREAQARADVHLGLLDDMRAIAERTRPDERVMWVTPAYIALLAGRHGVPTPEYRQEAEGFRKALLASRADYIFLSTYHPRETVSDAAWRASQQALRGHVDVVHERRRGEAVVSLLLRPRRLP